MMVFAQTCLVATTLVYVSLVCSYIKFKTRDAQSFLFWHSSVPWRLAFLQSNLNESYWDEEDEYAQELEQDDGRGELSMRVLLQLAVQSAYYSGGSCAVLIVLYLDDSLVLFVGWTSTSLM